ncbi:RNA polymerase sigma factor [Clostridium brassicae]|uniref:RNA polymerase sigma factor n=1 Tax=Clostridium brassicae TaxID=2999072 RepID=A0ABT4DD71_9CLOT|nr:RNA polymerase sigma factor [Clostridium brassicae]MCY6960245.1 RNA polymerase sigma factor [Clostridium brassicae]
MCLIYKQLYRFIYSITNDQYLTEDIFQETLMKAYEKFNTIKDIQKFKSWIFCIAKNENLSWIKKYNREIPSEDFYLELLEDSLGDIPEELLIKSETKKRLRESIKLLKPIDQKIIYLRYYYNLALNEIALIIGMNENTVKTHHMRSKKKLYKHIDTV